MPATNQLPKIAGLAQRIAPLGRKQRGMPIEHDDWNALIDVLQGLLEIERAQEESTQTSLEERFALQKHEHLGQVTAAWLDPSLQAALGATDGGISVRTTVAEVTWKVDALGAEAARLLSRVEDQQKNLDRFAVNDVDRSKALRNVDERFASVENLRTLVATVNRQVDSLGANVDTVLELRRSLSDVNGKPIDIAGIRKDVAGLQRSSEYLNGIDGKPVRLLDIELKLKELSDATGIAGAGGLEGRLATLSNDLEARLNVRTDERSSAIREELLKAATIANSELENRLRTMRAETDESLSSGIHGVEERLNKSVADQVTGAIDLARKEVTASAAGIVEQLLADQRIETEAQMKSLQEKLQERTQVDIASAISRVGEMMSKTFDVQFTEMRASFEASLDLRFRRERESLLSEADARTSAALERRLANLDANIGQSVAAALRMLPDQIATTVKFELAAADIAGQIQRAITTVSGQLRGELSQAVADQQMRTTKAIDGVLEKLHGEMDSSVKALREETNKSIDKLRSEMKLNLNTEVNRLSACIDAGIKQVNTKANPLPVTRPIG